jgi:hypothetical protein
MARSARYDVSPGTRRPRRIRRNNVSENRFSLDAFRRLRLQIGGANIAGADRALRACLPVDLSPQTRHIDLGLKRLRYEALVVAVGTYVNPGCLRSAQVGTCVDRKQATCT